VDSGVVRALDSLFSNWNVAAPVLPTVALAQAPTSSRVYLYDRPGAAQSVLRFGHPGPLRTDPAFDAVRVLNYRLGGGGFASRLTQELREGKGYTYGINSQFSASSRQGGFLVQSSVRSNVTLEAAELIRDLISSYGSTYTLEDLEVSRSFLLRSQARAFESLGAKLNMLGEIADYALADNYVLEQAALAEALTVENIRGLAERYLQPEAMHYVIVGDAASQAARLAELGFGEPVMLNAIGE
jgi:zinc protease